MSHFISHLKNHLVHVPPSHKLKNHVGIIYLILQQSSNGSQRSRDKQSLSSVLGRSSAGRRRRRLAASSSAVVLVAAITTGAGAASLDGSVVLVDDKVDDLVVIGLEVGAVNLVAVAAVAVDVVVVAVGDDLVDVVFAVTRVVAGKDAATLGGALVVGRAVEEAGVTVESDGDDCDKGELAKTP